MVNSNYYSDGVITNVSSAFGAQPLSDSFADLPTTPPPYTGPASDGTISDDTTQTFGQVGENVGAFPQALGIFAGGSLLAGAGLAAAGATSAGGELTSMVWDQPTTVIGNSADISQYAGNSGYNILFNVPNWSIEMNQAWIQTTINAGQSAMLASPLVAGTFFNGGIYNEGFTVTGMEAGWLIGGAGYQLVGSFLVPPVP